MVLRTVSTPLMSFGLAMHYRPARTIKLRGGESLTKVRRAIFRDCPDIHSCLSLFACKTTLCCKDNVILFANVMLFANVIDIRAMTVV
jgi:hypothetical protein